MSVPRFSAISAFFAVGGTVINKPHNQQIERIITTLKPPIFNMLLEKENGKIHREEFIAKLGRKAGRIVSVLPRGRPKKQRHK